MSDELLRHGLREVLPENFEEWPKRTVRMLGQTTCVARRCGVTVQVIQDASGWWHLVKIHRGQAIARKTTHKLPSSVTDAVFAALPRRAAA